MSAQTDSETEPAAASIHRPSAKASAKRKPGRPPDPCNDHFVFHTLDRKLLSCKHCKPYERKTTRGVADPYEHLINCSEFLDNHPEQHAEMQAFWLEKHGASKVVQQEVENQPVAMKQKVRSNGTQGRVEQHLVGGPSRP